MGCRTEVQRDELESHLECATKSHLDLACGELRDTQENVKGKITHFDRLEERVNILDEQLDKATDIQHQHQYEVDSLQQQHQRRVDQLEQKVKTCQQEHQRRVDQLEQKVKTCQTNLEQKISMERKIFLVCLVLGLVFLTFYLTKLEDRVQKKLEEKLSVIQNLHEKNLGMVKKELEDRFQKKLDDKVSVIQRLQKENVGMVKKDLEDRFRKKLDDKVRVLQRLQRESVGMVKKELDDKFNSFNTDLSNKLLILEVDTEKSRIFIWKITSFEDKLRQGKNNEKMDIDSDPFYAFGYRLMLNMYPNGNGAGEHTHLSIFICIMKGEYDAILPWGFSKRVTITLIDQQDDPNQRRNVVYGFTADPTQKRFKKPVEHDTGSCFGFPQFVSHNDVRTKSFVVDDTLFIKVQVDSSSWLQR